jgi:hypothetical protein
LGGGDDDDVDDVDDVEEDGDLIAGFWHASQAFAALSRCFRPSDCGGNDGGGGRGGGGDFFTPSSSISCGATS